MIQSFCVLLLFQLAGEVICRALSVPLPGPVIGMALLAAWLLKRPPAKDHPLRTTSNYLLDSMGLLFVPAGVGIVASLDLLRAQWFPITISLIGSTLASLLVTASIMHWYAVRSDFPKSNLTVSE